MRSLQSLLLNVTGNSPSLLYLIRHYKAKIHRLLLHTEAYNGLSRAILSGRLASYEATSYAPGMSIRKHTDILHESSVKRSGTHWPDLKEICSRDGMIHRCIAVLQYNTGIDTTFNVSIYRVSQ